MHVPLSAHGTRVPGAVYLFDCPACRRPSVACTTLTLREDLKLAHLIPLGTHTSRFVTCTACAEEFVCRVDFAVLRGLGPAEVAECLVLRVSPVDVTLALASIPFALVPVIGVMLAFGAFWLNRGRRHWTRTCSRLGLALAVAVSVFFAAATFLEKP